MGFLSQLSTVTAPARPYALTAEEYRRAFWGGEELPNPWLPVEVTPELALTLSYVYSAVEIISADFGTMTCQLFRDLGNDDRAKVSFNEAGIGQLAYQLRWQPNPWQTAKAFWSTLAWQYLLRPAAYAEIVYLPGLSSVILALMPRHPDRVTGRLLPDGVMQYRLLEPNGQYRTITQDEMFVVRNTSADGLNAVSRIGYGASAIQSGISLQDFTKNYFKKGATAALLATYKGVQADVDEATLHKSITRYMSGAENAGGLLLVPEDIDVKALGVDPEKAQLLGLKSLNGRDIARLFKMPPSWLGIENSTSYASETQDEARYTKHVQMPMVVEFEQAIQRDLILMPRGQIFAKFNMDYLHRGDAKTRFEAYEIAIRSRVMRPSEARVKEDMNRDPELDRLSAADHRPGGSAGSGTHGRGSAGGAQASWAVRATLLSHDAARRCLRREREAVRKLAAKHAADAEGWQGALVAFFADHAGFVAETMRMPLPVAQQYAEDHREALAHEGLSAMETACGEAMERDEAERLCLLALGNERMAA